MQVIKVMYYSNLNKLSYFFAVKKFLFTLVNSNFYTAYFVTAKK